jgi:Fe-Mn family superoxide dismutase
MAFKLADLPYAYNALEPYIDARTMEIHYSKHHSAYTNNLNNAISGSAMDNLSIEDLIKNVSKYPVAVRNNGGGYFNHNLFWKFMKPNGGGQPAGELLAAINKSFGSFDDFRKQFTTAAATRFGSGWAWLVKTPSGLVVTSTPNQDNPLMDIAEVKGTPVLTIDVWEHAYYLKYQNRRPEYIEAFWNVINWDFAAEQFKS